MPMLVLEGSGTICAPVFIVLDASCMDVAILDIEPLVGKEFRRLTIRLTTDEISVYQIVGCLQDQLRGRRVKGD
jgi:hypothetical protein